MEADKSAGGSLSGPQEQRLSKPVTSDAFEIWLKLSLQKLVEDVVSEPVPAELLRLLAQKPHETFHD